MSEFKIHPIVMGTKIFDKGMMTYQHDYGKKYTIPIYCWYIEGGDRKILVDTGEMAPIISEDREQAIGGKIYTFEDGLARWNLAPEDIDIVIEGDGIEFAREFARRHHVRVRSHRKFGTAVLIFLDGFKVDVASARLEYYERPAALPQVEMSSIKLDLYRRDFTINTLAIRLNPAYFGELIDFFGARKDIKEKTIRVIHNLSFVEDPTRILRAIRFEQRFGFHLGRLTQSLIENAVKFNFLERLDGRRLLSELILVLQEEEVILNLERMQELSVLSCIHPSFTFDKARKALCERIKEAIRWYELSFLEEAYVQWKIYFMALIDGLGKSEVVHVVRRLCFSEKEGRELLTNREHIKNVLVRMARRRTLGTSELYHLLKPLPVECIVRGYISGSAWKDYTGGKPVSGIRLPAGLKESSRLPEPVFTPSTKAPEGEHDMPISQDETARIVGK